MQQRKAGSSEEILYGPDNQNQSIIGSILAAWKKLRNKG